MGNCHKKDEQQVKKYNKIPLVLSTSYKENNLIIDENEIIKHDFIYAPSLFEAIQNKFYGTLITNYFIEYYKKTLHHNEKCKVYIPPTFRILINENIIALHKAAYWTKKNEFKSEELLPKNEFIYKVCRLLKKYTSANTPVNFQIRAMYIGHIKCVNMNVFLPEHKILLSKIYPDIWELLQLLGDDYLSELQNMMDVPSPTIRPLKNIIDTYEKTNEEIEGALTQNTIN